jgi:hypothetical protein
VHPRLLTFRRLSLSSTSNGIRRLDSLGGRGGLSGDSDIRSRRPSARRARGVVSTCPPCPSHPLAESGPPAPQRSDSHPRVGAGVICTENRRSLPSRADREGTGTWCRQISLAITPTGVRDGDARTGAVETVDDNRTSGGCGTYPSGVRRFERWPSPSLRGILRFRPPRCTSNASRPHCFRRHGDGVDRVGGNDLRHYIADH